MTTSSKITQERTGRAKRFNDVREKRMLDCKEFSRMLSLTHSVIVRVCSGENGMTLALLLKVSHYLTDEECEYIQFGKTKLTLEEVLPKELSKAKYVLEEYTETEHEIIKMLRKMPKLKKTILTSLRNKYYLTKDFEDFVKA